MNAMGIVFILIRLAVVLLGLVAALAIAIPIVVVGLGLAPYAFVLIVGVWLFIIAPASFIIAALKNDFEIFERFIKDTLRSIEILLRDIWKRISGLRKFVRDLYVWILGGEI